MAIMTHEDGITKPATDSILEQRLRLEQQTKDAIALLLHEKQQLAETFERETKRVSSELKALGYHTPRTRKAKGTA